MQSSAVHSAVILMDTYCPRDTSCTCNPALKNLKELYWSISSIVLIVQHNARATWGMRSCLSVLTEPIPKLQLCHE